MGGQERLPRKGCSQNVSSICLSYTLSITRTMGADFSCSTGGWQHGQEHCTSGMSSKTSPINRLQKTDNLPNVIEPIYVVAQLAEYGEWVIGTHLHQPPYSLAYLRALAPV